MSKEKNSDKLPSVRRNRAETLPSMNTAPPFTFKVPQENTMEDQNNKPSNPSPFRNRLSSYSTNFQDASTGYPNQTLFEDPFNLKTKSYHAPSFSTSNLSQYEISAAKTLDFLGLNEDTPPPVSSQKAISPYRRSRSTTLPGNNANAAPFNPGSTVHSMTPISDGESENTAHSPNSGQSTLLEGAQKEVSESECLSLKIENLSAETTLSKLTVELSKFGEIESIQISKKDSVGHVTFSNAEEAKAALNEMNNKSFLQSVLKVSFVKDSTNDQSSNVKPTQQSGTSSDPNSLANALASLSINDTNATFYKQTLDYYNHQAEDFKQAIAEISVRGLQKHELLMSYDYAITLPPIPNPNFKKRVEPTRLRELRKQLESEPTRETVDNAFDETRETWVDLCSDYIGNIIIQKLIEHGSEYQKTSLIKSVAPYMAAIGIHKNGTWAIQKMIECADTAAQIVPIAAALKPYTPALLLDQFGNYVVQCCLKFESPHNQFIFDSIYSRCSEIAQGRYGARAIRTCLDSQFTTESQKELVSEALMRNAYALSTNANGSLLLNWILDSQFTEHYMGIVVNLSTHLPQLCCHKLASSIIVRLINQQLDPQAREYLLYKLFFESSGPVIKDILTDHSQGNQFVQKILNSPYLDEQTKASIQMAVTKYSSQMVDPQQLLGYRRILFDDPSMPYAHITPSQSLQGAGLEATYSPFTTPLPAITPEAGGANWPWLWNGQLPMQSNLQGYSSSSANPSPNVFHSNTSYFPPATSGGMNTNSMAPSDSNEHSANSSHIALNIN